MNASKERRRPGNKSHMKVLLISPRYPDTFWSLRHAVQFSPAKATFPPLGLLTVAALLPADWPKKLVDMNVEPLTEAHLQWAEVAFVSAMAIQSASTQDILRRCRACNLKVVAGGPLFTHLPDMDPSPDHVVIGEAEELMPRLVQDLIQNHAQAVYRAEGFPEVTRTPVPAWHLLKLSNYTDTSIQFTRGCPFNCEFCDVVLLNGRRPRYKTTRQIMAELDALYAAGWRGEVMFVDDNFIGHKGRAKELLTVLKNWQSERHYPFWFMTQASLNLADDPELLTLMSQADFKKVFIGFESTATESLDECHKHQNQNRDSMMAVRVMQQSGLEVMGGFILGFDSDPPSIFDDQVRFIQSAGIPAAMMGLLSAPPGTPLWHRLEAEGRLLGLPSGDNTTDIKALNFIPKMGRKTLVTGYKSVLKRLYDPEAYFQRVLTFFRHYRPNGHRPPQPPRPEEIRAFCKIVWHLGLKEPIRLTFWRFLGRVLLRHRHLFPEAVMAAVCGYHFHLISRRFIDQQIDN